MRCVEPSQQLRRRGFTLVELLVVIFIIGILIAMLLPAVQAAREAANKAQCQNNLKQVSLAIQSYEDARKTLPIGCATAPLGGYGLSWWTQILSYLEQEALSDGLDRDAKNCGHPQLHFNNGQVANGAMVEAMLCPSSPLPQSAQVGTLFILLPSYVGLAGSTNEDGLTGSPVSPCCMPLVNGEISAGGVLVPNLAIRLCDVLDGTSNTFFVGETSDFAYAGSTAQNISSGFNIGWMSGTNGTGTPPNYDAPQRRPCYGITTLKYLPNSTNYNRPGIRNNHGPNNPLLSAHPGGVNCAKGDGSVHFISESVSMTMLRRAVTRKDGAVASGL